jgi:hypothetical protein
MRRLLMIVAAYWGALPIVMAIALNYLRPDLVAAPSENVFAPIVTALFFLLDGLGTAIMMVGWWLLGLQDQKRTAVCVLEVVVGVFPILFCFLPAIAIVLFGPIVYAFMYGGAIG